LVIEKQVRLNFMQHSIPSATAEPRRIPEARYAYYRRCQVFRRNGDQCKAPAEKGSPICHAHAAQQTMAFRQDLERRIVLAEAVAEMRRQGHGNCELANLLTDFKGIQVTLAVMARAIIGGRIDCKTAGRLVVHLQTMSKLLRTLHKNKTLPLINADNSDLQDVGKNNSAANEREKTRIVLVSPRFSTKRVELEPTARKYWTAYATIERVDDDTGMRTNLEQRAYRDRGQAHGPPKLRAA
jgi:hypothetical protein